MTTKSGNPSLDMTEADERKLNIPRTFGMLLIACAIGLISNWAGAGIDPLTALPGMAILFACSFLGFVLARFMPFYLPAVAWVSLVAILITIPGVPGSETVLAAVKQLNFLSLATPALAYGGLALSQSEFNIAKKSGWKLVIVAICVMIGTYLGSVVIADVTLRLMD